MATSISSIGVGSGLPLDTLLEQFRTAENAPLAALQSRATKEQQRFSAYGTLNSALDAVSTAAANLGKSQTFHAVKTSVTGETFTASAKAGSNAIPGNYAIKVEQMATGQSLASKAGEERTESLVQGGSGKVDISFKVGDTNHTVSLDANKSSLEDVVKAINGKSELKVSATLVNTGAGEGNKAHRLIISADGTGTESQVSSIEVTHGTDGTGDLSRLQAMLNYGGSDSSSDGMSQSVAAQDAKILINDAISITSQSNTIENAIDGINITLNKAAAEDATPDTLKVTRDDTVTTTAVNNFVNAYNALQSTIKALTAYDVDSQKGAALTGDTLARRAQSQVRDAINGLAVNGVTLSSLGIKTDANTGNLSVDTDKLNEALKNNRADVEQLFAGDSGLSKRVASAVEVFTKSDGLIKTSQDSITRTLKLLEGQYEQMEARIDQKMETYRTQFVQLDTFMAQMNSVSSYLGTQLSMLENLGNNSKSK